MALTYLRKKPMWPLILLEGHDTTKKVTTGKFKKSLKVYEKTV